MVQDFRRDRPLRIPEDARGVERLRKLRREQCVDEGGIDLRAAGAALARVVEHDGLASVRRDPGERQMLVCRAAADLYRPCVGGNTTGRLNGESSFLQCSLSEAGPREQPLPRTRRSIAG